MRNEQGPIRSIQNAYASPMNIIASNGRWSLGDMQVGLNGGDGNGAWPAANRAILIPFFIRRPTVPLSMYVMKGSVTSGNFDLGIYDLAGNRLCSTGSTADATASACVTVALSTNPLLAPGQYFMALVFDNATATVDRYAYSALLILGFGVQQSAAAVPLASTLTLANPASAYTPIFGIGLTSSSLP